MFEMRQIFQDGRSPRTPSECHAWNQEEEEDGQEGETAGQEADDEEGWSSKRLNESAWFEDHEPGAVD
ncbi:MAG: hypothetical protein O7D91_13545 [Planctomycetota bacterium]|nr:hypothetical protein [Planctomycetota bacterium]